MKFPDKTPLSAVENIFIVEVFGGKARRRKSCGLTEDVTTFVGLLEEVVDGCRISRLD